MQKQRIKKLPDRALLHKLFEYDFEQGTLRWKSNGKEAGWTNDRGYRCVRVNKKQYYAHRVIYFMFVGKDPGKKCIDHIDGDKQNNKLINLRAVSFQENLLNTTFTRKLGHKPKPDKRCLYYV